MPVERTRGHAGRALAVSLLVIPVLLGGGWLASNFLFARQDSFDVRLGSQTFEGGNAERLAAEIEDRGPIFYGDIGDSGSGDKRDIILQHIGDDPDEGWYAFRAQPPGRDRDCTWQWRADDEEFVAACDESLTAPADGEGLESYPVSVDDGRLDIDLNFDRRETTTESSTTTAPESGNVPTSTEG